MCCGQPSRPTSQVVKQTDAPAQTKMQSPKQVDTSNPVNNTQPNSTNITRANEVRRNQYHQNHFGGR